MTVPAQNVCFYDSEDGMNVAATVWAPQSVDGGKTIDNFVAICDHEKDHWFDGADWTEPTFFLPITETPPPTALPKEG